jgi:hypothetical protein
MFAQREERALLPNQKNIALQERCSKELAYAAVAIREDCAERAL